MPRSFSTKEMINRLSGLINKDELSGWEEGFVTNLKRQSDAGEVTNLSDAQIEKLDELHSKHFAQA
ncbi:conserved protein of unknown function [Pararobbsia alpina]|uniref:hypothetical protein n=1 Tax=Pararobbsia alpina TaxID=621374 RepID=UPI0039A5A46C